MKIGTKSVLYGAHQFIVHPWFVRRAWNRLYGPTNDWRLRLAFFVHDVGYIGKSDMDGDEGETHVEAGANFLANVVYACTKGDRATRLAAAEHWRQFSLYHSRFYAKRDNAPPSRLCAADKLAISLTPAWLYLPLANLTGEIHEYMSRVQGGREGSKYSTMGIDITTQRTWYKSVQDYLEKWAYEHKDGRPDTWTPAANEYSKRQGKL